MQFKEYFCNYFPLFCGNSVAEFEQTRILNPEGVSYPLKAPKFLPMGLHQVSHLKYSLASAFLFFLCRLIGRICPLSNNDVFQLGRITSMIANLAVTARASKKKLKFCFKNRSVTYATFFFKVLECFFLFRFAMHLFIHNFFFYRRFLQPFLFISFAIFCLTFQHFFR